MKVILLSLINKQSIDQQGELDQLLEIYVCMCLSPNCVCFFATPWTVAHQAPLPWIPQARILKWIAIPFSRGSFQPRD